MDKRERDAHSRLNLHSHQIQKTKLPGSRKHSALTEKGDRQESKSSPKRTPLGRRKADLRYNPSAIREIKIRDPSSSLGRKDPRRVRREGLSFSAQISAGSKKPITPLKRIMRIETHCKPLNPGWTLRNVSQGVAPS